MEKLIEQLKEINDEVDFESADNLVTGHILASFDIIQIIMMLKDEYDINVPPAQIVPENFNSAEAIWKMVQRLQDD